MTEQVSTLFGINFEAVESWKKYTPTHCQIYIHFENGQLVGLLNYIQLLVDYIYYKINVILKT